MNFSKNLVQATSAYFGLYAVYHDHYGTTTTWSTPRAFLRESYWWGKFIGIDLSSKLESELGDGRSRPKKVGFLGREPLAPKFSRYIYKVHRNKGPLKIWEKREGGCIQVGTGTAHIF